MSQLYLVDYETVFWQICSADWSVVGSQQEQDVRLQLTSGGSSGLITDVKSGNLNWSEKFIFKNFLFFLILIVLSSLHVFKI